MVLVCVLAICSNRFSYRFLVFRNSNIFFAFVTFSFSLTLSLLMPTQSAFALVCRSLQWAVCCENSVFLKLTLFSPCVRLFLTSLFTRFPFSVLMTLVNEWLVTSFARSADSSWSSEHCPGRTGHIHYINMCGRFFLAYAFDAIAQHRLEGVRRIPLLVCRSCVPFWLFELSLAFMTIVISTTVSFCRQILLNHSLCRSEPRRILFP